MAQAIRTDNKDNVSTVASGNFLAVDARHLRTVNVNMPAATVAGLYRVTALPTPGSTTYGTPTAVWQVIALTANQANPIAVDWPYYVVIVTTGPVYVSGI